MAAACALAAFVWASSAAKAEEEQPPPVLTFPFPEGQTWRVTCGYTLPDHAGDADDPAICGHSGSQWNLYALDLQHAGGPAEAEGQPVLAAAPGVVSRATRGDGLGWHVFLDHGGGYATLYAHMKEPPSVEEGQEVGPGAVLGLVGCTGRCTGPHIHFALLKDGVSVLPEPLCGYSDITAGQLFSGCAPPAPTEPVGLTGAGADFDGDGVNDFAVVYQAPGVQPFLDLFRSDGASFAVQPRHWPAEDRETKLPASHVVAGDFDGNGQTELAALFVAGENCQPEIGTLLFVEPGSAIPGYVAWLGAPGDCDYRLSHATTGDFDGDGRSDIALVVETEAGYAIDVLRSEEDATFTGPERWWQSETDVAVAHLMTGDFDDDGRSDLVVLTSNGCQPALGILSSTGTGFTLADNGLWAGGCIGELSQAATGDFDGDGQTDDVALFHAVNKNARLVNVLISDGGHLSLSDTPWWADLTLDLPERAGGLVPGDFDGDGRTDLAFLTHGGDCSSRVRVLASQGDHFHPSDWWAGGDYCGDTILHTAP